MFTVILWLAFASSVVKSHLCIIHPHQRGAMDIQQAGDSSCFRHGAPCGGQTPGAATAAFKGGKTAFIQFQQNFNHYEVGFPGYMDIALSRSPNSTRFEVLATIGDTNAHAQWNQQNYTIPLVIEAEFAVFGKQTEGSCYWTSGARKFLDGNIGIQVLPTIECTGCVLRMRYVSNKPGEEIFYQCSDINITLQDAPGTTMEIPGQSIPLPLRRVNNFISSKNKNTREPSLKTDSKALYGFSWDILKNPGTDLVSVDSISGEISTQSYQRFYFNMGVGVQYGTPSPMEESYKFLMDQIACHSREIPYIFLLEHRDGNIIARPNKILWIDLEAKVIAGEYEINQPASGHFVALSPYQRTNFLALLLDEQLSGSYNLTFATLDYMGNFQERLNVTIGKEFINFLWATPDLTKQVYYALLGDENSPRQLKTVMWTYNITKNAISSMVNLNVSRYTISSIQVYEKTGQLFAVSPGLFGQQSPAWSLVEVDPITGSISHVMDLAQPGFFEDYYGGTVFNLDQTNGVMYHVFRVSGYTTDVIATIDLNNNDVTFSQLTNLRHVYNLANTYFPV